MDLLADISGVMRPVAAAEAAVSGFAGQDATVNLGAKDDASPTIARVAGETQRLDSEDGTVNLEARDQASPKITLVQRLLAALSGQNATATLDARDQASPKVRALQAVLAAYAGKTATATADVNATPAESTLARLEPALNRFDGRNIEIEVDVDDHASGPLAHLGSSMGGVSAKSAALRTAVLAAAVGLGSLAAGAGTAIGAVAGLGAAMGLLVGAAVPTVRALSEHKTNADALKTAEEGVTEAEKAHAQAQTALAETIRQGAQAEAAARQQVQDRVAALADTRRKAAQEEAQAANQIAELERGLANQREVAAGQVEQQNRQIAAARANLAEVQRQAAQQEQADLDALRQAEANLADVRRNNAEAVNAANQRASDAAERVQVAERDLVQSREDLQAATANLTDAQTDYNQALATEQERIAIAENDLEGMRISQEQSAIDLARAEQDLAEKRKSGTALDVQEAELRIQEIRNRQEDSAFRLEDAERDLADQRANGTDELNQSRDAVKGAYEEQQTAAERVQEQEANLGKAREEAAQAQQEVSKVLAEGARNEAKAREDIARVQRDAAIHQDENARKTQEAQQAITNAVTDAARSQQQSNEQIASMERQIQDQRNQAAIKEEDNALAVQRAQDDVAQSVNDLRQVQEENAAKMAAATDAVTEALRELTLAQEKAAEAAGETGAALTASQAALLAAWEGFASRFTAAFKPANDVLNNLGVRMLGLAQTALPALGVAALATMTGFAAGIDAVVASATAPEQLAIFRDYLANVPSLMEPAVRIAGDLALAIFNIFAVPVNSGLAAALLQDIAELTDRFLAWTQSAEGQQFLLDLFQKLDGPVRNVAWAVGQIAAGFFKLATSDAAITLLDNLATLAGTIGQQIPGLQLYIQVLNQALELFNMLPTPVQSAVIQLAALNFVLGGFPVAVVAALVGLLADLAVKSLFLRAFGLPGMFSIIGTALGGLGTAISAFVSSALFYLQYFFVISLPQFAALALEFFTVTIPAAIGAGLGPIAAVLATLLGSWYYILGPAGLIVGVLVGFAAFLAGGWVLLVVAAVASAAAAIAVAIFRNWESVKAAAQSIVTWFAGLPEGLRAAFANALSIANPIGGLLTYVLNQAAIFQSSGGESGFLSWFSALPGWAQSALTTSLNAVSIFDGLYNAVASVVEWFQNNGAEGILSWFSNLPSWAANALSTALSSVPIFGPIFDAVSAAYNWFAGGGFDGIISTFSSLAGSLARGIWDGISSNPLFQAVFDSVSSFFDWVGGLWDSFVSLGKNLIAGFINGVIQKGKELIQAVLTPVQNAYEAVKNYLGIASPSKLFYKLASEVPEGIIAAFRDGEGLVTAGANRLAGAAGVDFGVKTPSFAGGSGVSGGGNLPQAVSSSLARRGKRRRKQQPIIIQNHVILDGKEMAKWVNDTTHEAFRSSQLRGDYLGGGL